MTRLRKFLHLTSRDRRLLITAVFLLGTIRLGLRFIPFRTVQRIVGHRAQAPTSSHQIDQPSIEQLVWAVKVASQYVPKATCLTQALATQIVLGRHGYSTQLCIGAARTQERRLEAHAWVENQGKVVVGGGETSRYTLLRDI